MIGISYQHQIAGNPVAGILGKQVSFWGATFFNRNGITYVNKNSRQVGKIITINKTGCVIKSNDGYRFSRKWNQISFV